MLRSLKLSAVMAILLVQLGLSPVAAQTQEEDEKNTINNYLVDITSGAVSASGIIGLNKTAVQQVETSQALVAALQPFTSGDLKSGVGLAITPARTSLLPMSARRYKEDDLYRLLGGITLSFGQNNKSISSVNYKQTGFSADVNYFINKEQDPVVIAHTAYSECRGPTEKAIVQLEEDIVNGVFKGTPEERDKKRTELQTVRNAEYKTCVDKAITAIGKSEWNAARVNFSLGEGSIKASGGNSYSLGKLMAINGLYPVGGNGVIQVSLRTAWDAVDPTSLATTPSFKKGSLLAARYTFGGTAKADDPLPLRALIEISNARESSPAIFKDVFLYAVGLDYRIYKDVWLEFRVGRNRTQDLGDKKETTGLMTLNIAPSATLLGPK